jgi:hypothetical protein
VQVGLADVLIDAVHAALQDREEDFHGVGVDIPADIFAFGVLDASVRVVVPAKGGERWVLRRS